MALSADKFLANDESVLGQYKGQNELFVATDRRLIMVKKGSMMDASYNHVNSIGMTTTKNKIFIYFGILLFIVGIIVAAVTASSSPTGGIVILVLGIILIALYFIYKHSVYTLSLSSGQKILLPSTKTSNAESFIKILRDKVR